MRGIKFRAWLKHDGEWLMSYDLAFDEFEPINDLLANVENLMQYTGLKDKNGKEIYESDLVKHHSGDLLSEVYFDGAAFKLRNKVWNDIYLNNWPANSFEVVGNLYENRELLDGR